MTAKLNSTMNDLLFQFVLHYDLFGRVFLCSRKTCIMIVANYFCDAYELLAYIETQTRCHRRALPQNKKEATHVSLPTVILDSPYM